MARTRTPTADTPRGEIARAVRAEMARTGVTGGELAEKLGMTQRSMSRRLTGDATFRDAELVEIAAVLGVPVTQLLPATEPAGDAR